MEPTRTVKVWDPLVRVFHWTLVVAFATAYASGEEWSWLHTNAGYLILGLLALRLLWGVVGTRHARFGDFVTGPGKVLAYLRDLVTFRARRYLGHNPAGGAMILLLLVSLLATTLSGLAAWGAEGGGPLAGTAVAGEASEALHEFFADFTLLLVVLHVGGVVLGSLLHGENLVRAMFSGRKEV